MIIRTLAGADQSQVQCFRFLSGLYIFPYSYLWPLTLPDFPYLPSARGTRQKTLGETLVGKAGFAECLLSDTRQRFCRVPKMHSAKKSERDGGRPLTAASPSA